MFHMKGVSQWKYNTNSTKVYLGMTVFIIHAHGHGYLIKADMSFVDHCVNGQLVITYTE